jgi:type IV pilus assembly protein PilY1
MSRYKIYAFMVAVSVAFAYPALVFAQCTEPVMSNYTSTPIFITQAVKPNVMIILDNSGSMNYAAYGTWQGPGGTITDAKYTGTPPFCGEINTRVIQIRDDAEEREGISDKTWCSSNDLDFGSGNEAFSVMVGLRFQDVAIPQGSTISEAWIELTGGAASAGDYNFTIRGQAADDTVQFSDQDNDIKNRPNTAASVPWSGTAPWEPWSPGPPPSPPYKTADITSIVQEIVNRQAWHEGNSMVFKIAGTGMRVAKSYDTNPTQAPLLHVKYLPATCTRYYGLFDPDSQYRYGSGVFVRDPAGAWNGNFLNWLCMRRIDIARKVIMGGLATSRTGGGNTTAIGEDPNTDPTAYWKRRFNSTGSTISLTPHVGDFLYGIKGGYLYVDLDWDGDPFDDAGITIKVEKDEVSEPESFYQGNLAGVLQKIGRDKARWGLAWFNDFEGGRVSQYMGTKLTDMETDIQNEKGGKMTPQAETLYEVARYFQQVSPYYATNDYTVGKDPFDWGTPTGKVPCSKNFVLLVTDGESTWDRSIPEWLQDYDGDGNDTVITANYGTDYLDDVALWARTNDLRSDLDGDQNLILYVVYAFGKGSRLLQDAARNGGFEDRNGNNRPDQVAEYDKDNNGFPDTYYESEDGYQLERELIRAINDILERAASGTAVSVLATSGEGEGNVIQAYFLPVVKTLDYDVTWIGHLQSLWVDSHGNLREDSDGDLALDVTKDMVVEYIVSSTGDARIRRYEVSGTTPYPTYSSENLEAEIPLDEVRPLFESGRLLHTRNPDTRRIFTFIDKNKDGFVDDSGSIDDDTGEVVRFDYGTDAVTNVKPYLGVRDYTYWKYLGALHDDRARNLIMYIRGMEPGYSGSATFTGTGTLNIRKRVLDNHVWKLGDIVHSTPVSVAKPADNYHIIYGDESYLTYYNAVKDRETAVYVGANDGMLHAFTSWKYNTSSKQYVKPTGAPSEEQIGDELWAYIPQALLPHLKWIPHTDYGHVYYVDLKPKIFDAKIISNGTHYTDPSVGSGEKTWGTILIGGLNFGGKQICAQDNFDNGSGVTTYETRTYNPVYFCMDITNPRQPRLLWEREFVGLNMSQSTPAVIKVNDKWLAVFGSGPTDFDGNCTTKGRVYVVDLETGRSFGNTSVFTSTVTNGWLFETVENNAFINSPVSFDKDLDYHVDGVYLGSAYYDTAASRWKGRAYKIAIHWDWVNHQPYTDAWNPNGAHPWKWVRLFDAEGPITAPMSLSIDDDDKVWVYMGTGRYISEADKTNTDTQYILGLKEPFFDTFYDGANGNYYHSYSDYSNSSPQVSMANLFDATPYVVRTDANVYLGGAFFKEWNQLVDWVGENYRGWYRTLGTRERVLSKYAILGGMVFAPTFVPNQDICGYGGDSWLYGLYYETGTSYYKPAFRPIGENNNDVLVRVFLGAGLASAAGIHVGQEAGARAFIQQSTGVISQQELSPAFTIKSGLINWRQK